MDINLMLTRLQLHICNDGAITKSRKVLWKSGFGCCSRDLPHTITHPASHSDVPLGHHTVNSRCNDVLGARVHYRYIEIIATSNEDLSGHVLLPLQLSNS
jgi:hypothetical protein